MVCPEGMIRKLENCKDCPVDSICHAFGVNAGLQALSLYKRIPRKLAQKRNERRDKLGWIL